MDITRGGGGACNARIPTLYVHVGTGQYRFLHKWLQLCRGPKLVPYAETLRPQTPWEWLAWVGSDTPPSGAQRWDDADSSSQTLHVETLALPQVLKYQRRTSAEKVRNNNFGYSLPPRVLNLVCSPGDTVTRIHVLGTWGIKYLDSNVIALPVTPEDLPKGPPVERRSHLYLTEVHMQGRQHSSLPALWATRPHTNGRQLGCVWVRGGIHLLISTSCRASQGFI